MPITARKIRSVVNVDPEQRHHVAVQVLGQEHLVGVLGRREEPQAVRHPRALGREPAAYFSARSARGPAGAGSRPRFQSRSAAASRTMAASGGPVRPRQSSPVRAARGETGPASQSAMPTSQNGQAAATAWGSASRGRSRAPRPAGPPSAKRAAGRSSSRTAQRPDGGEPGRLQARRAGSRIKVAEPGQRELEAGPEGLTQRGLAGQGQEQ